MNTEKELSGILHSISKPQNVFLILGVLFGFLFVFVTPPALVGDEPNHFFRAYQISEGQIVGEKREDLSGGWLPESVLYTNRRLVGNIEMNHDVKFDINLISEFLNLPLDRENKVFERFPNTVVYSPIPYIPQVLGIIAGKSFDASPLLLIYFARISNLLFFLGLAYWAIRKTPVQKWVFCLLCLTPTNVFQVASASVDAFTYGICFLLVSYFLFYAFDKNSEFQNADVAKLILISLLAVLSKQAYVFLPALFLLIPPGKFRSLKTYLVTFIILLSVCFGAVLGWSIAVKPIFLPYRIDMPINPNEQAAFVINHPFNFLVMSVSNYIDFSGYYFLTFFGQLTWLDLYVPEFLPILLFFVLLTAALLDNDWKIVIAKFHKLLFSAIISATLLLISLLLYMSWSPIGGNNIEGIQGRYFIPVAPLFFLFFYNNRLKSKFFEGYFYITVYLTVIFSLLITLNAVINRYYV